MIWLSYKNVNPLSFLKKTLCVNEAILLFSNLLILCAPFFESKGKKLFISDLGEMMANDFL